MTFFAPSIVKPSCYFTFIFEKKTNKNLTKNIISFIVCDPDANVRLYAYRI